MTGVSFTVALDAATIARIDTVLARLAGPGMADLVYKIGQLVESQTNERIDREKTGPDGALWAAWSSWYARTRGSAQSLLVASDPGLRRSIENQTTGDRAIVGTNLIYAAMHQFGGTKAQFPHLWGDIPARPFLGLSGDNRSEIEELVVDMLGGVLE